MRTKVLSLRDPWATLVAIGAKKIETRGWPTDYRGPLAIHSSKAFTRDERWMASLGRIGFALRNAGITDLDALPRGAIIATCELTDVVATEHLTRWGARCGLTADEEAFGDYDLGRFGWVLENVRRLERPIPAAGTLGLWEYDLGEEAA